jgi:two-component system OmpR family sensor kinase
MDGGEGRMKNTLRRRLSITLGTAIFLAGAAAATASFGFGYFEAREMQDDVLRQIATLSTANADAPQEAKILTFHLPRDLAPGWLPPDLPPGFHSVESGDGETLRVYVGEADTDGRVVVAQSAALRDEAALNSALRTFVPVLLLLPLLAWLTLRVVASESKLIEEQRRFIADAAHELRTPLTALAVQAGNLQGATSPAAMTERIAQLRAGIDRARRVSEQLLNLARTREGSPARSTVDAGALARELLAEWMPAAAAKRIDLGLEERDAVTLRTAPEALRLILGNALDNALRYTPEGGEVTLRIFRQGNDAVLEVVDNGPGIPPSERERVFEPFRRLERGSAGGSGLGLAIARDAAARLNGRISLHERPGGGLIVRFRQRP